VLSGKATNTNFIVFGSTQFGAQTHDLPHSIYNKRLFSNNYKLLLTSGKPGTWTRFLKYCKLLLLK
jgi:hypothetical protein